MWKSIIRRRITTIGRGVTSTVISAMVLDRIDALFGSKDDEKTFSPATSSALSSQVVAMTIFAKWGLSGVATAFDHGLISEADFAYYAAASWSYRMGACSGTAIASLEDNANDSSQSFIADIFDDISAPVWTELCQDPETVAKIYTYLIPKVG